jgi:2-polyprenyl-6-methoxyphenol hydroxylase-like FAD-dependent oxidoreductase
MPAAGRFDVVVAGASIAGCTAARLFGLAGMRVALVERRPDPDAYKVVCTHQILSSAVPTIERLGLAPLLDEAGAVRSIPAAWTPYGGWLRIPDDCPRGYGITRRALDPILRRLATDTPGVELLPGQTVVGVLGDRGRCRGLEIESPDGTRRELGAGLTVAADGRDSTVARLARVPARVRPHNRFAYYAYWRGVTPRTTRARTWFLDPDVAAVFPNEDDLSVVAAVPHRARLAEFRADPETAYLRMLNRLPDAPDLGGAERTSKLIGKLHLPNKRRRAAQPGLAFVGDAALAADPLFGVGCGWAFQTAEWLFDHTRAAVAGDADLDTALERYRRSFARRLGLHQLQIADYSSGRRMRANERLIFRAATSDPVVGRAVERMATRRSSPVSLLDPRLVLRVLLAS